MYESNDENLQLEILSLEDSKLDADLIYKHLVKNSKRAVHMDIVDNEEDFISAISTRKYDIILSDFNLPNFNGFKALEHIKSICKATPMICVSGYIGEEVAAELLKQGAADYVSKAALIRLVHSVDRALKEFSDREKLENALQLLIESEEKNRLLIEGMQQGLALHEGILDENGKFCNYRFLDVNESFEKVTGLKRQEIIGNTVYDVLPAIEDFWINAYGHVVTTGEPIQFEKYSKELDKYFEVSAYSPKLNQFATIVTDISARKKGEEEILFLGYHDQLTGLYNRRFYEEELRRLDSERNLPLTIAMGDVNGLKLINDSFGHKTGDEILKKIAAIIKKGCRADDIIARIGGDEFGIVLPNTDASEAETIINRIRELASTEKVDSVFLSISFGHETKISVNQLITDIIKNTEDHMYRHKLYESSSMHSKTIELIMNTLYEKNHREMLHSKRVSEICENLATKMNFDLDDINQLKIAGLLHDIGKIGIDEKILNKPSKLNDDEWFEIKRHSEIGYRILSSVNEFSEVAEYVLQHQERWDGTGYPKNLQGEEISVQARIVGIADAYDAMTNSRAYGEKLTKEEAIDELKKCSGRQFDPGIVEIFINEVL